MNDYQVNRIVAALRKLGIIIILSFLILDFVLIGISRRIF